MKGGIRAIFNAEASQPRFSRLASLRRSGTRSPDVAARAWLISRIPDSALAPASGMSRRRRARPLGHLTVTLAPAASSLALMSAASCLETFSFTFCGAPSTRSLASFRPRSGRTRADFLDHVDLLVAAAGQHDGELGLLFGGFGRSGRGGARRGGHGHRRGGGDAPLLFQQLGELGGFQHGERGEVFDDLFEVGHGSSSFEAKRLG